MRVVWKLPCRSGWPVAALPLQVASSVWRPLEAVSFHGGALLGSTLFLQEPVRSGTLPCAGATAPHTHPTTRRTQSAPNSRRLRCAELAVLLHIRGQQ